MKEVHFQLVHSLKVEQELLLVVVLILAQRAPQLLSAQE